MMWMKGRRDCNGSEKIGNLLKKLRSEKGLTQEQFAEILNVSNRTVSRWETGSNMPDISLLVEIADFYDISIPEIINGERKSEKMNEEVKEVAKTMSDYARAEKEAIVKNIRIISVIGLVAFVVHALLDATGLHLKSSVLEHLNLYSETLIYVTVVMFPLYTTGLLSKIHRRNKDTKFDSLTQPVKLIIAAVAALAVAAIIGLVLSCVF